jgi:hypothetical protein
MTHRTIQHLGQPREDVGDIDIILWAETGAHAIDRAHLWAIHTYGPTDLDGVTATDLGPLPPCDIEGCQHQPQGRTYRVTARRLEPR